MPPTSSARSLLARRLAAALDRTGPLPTPLMVVDLDAFDANAADLVRRAAGKPVRVASKSVRVPDLITRALATPGFRGVLAFTLREALWLHDRGVSADLLVAYPTTDRAALTRLVASPEHARAITLMVDDTDHLDLVDAVRGPAAPPVRVAIDVDAGLRLAGQHLGPKRSPLAEPQEVAALARSVVARPGFRLVGVMTYEGQVAGMPDEAPLRRGGSLVVRGVKRASIAQLQQRRRAVARLLEEIAELELWNAGGSGSVETTAADPVVTEVAAGSGLLVPALFDHYRDFEPRPAAFFAVPVVRRPSESVATVLGGGLVASGPAGGDRLPVPWLPEGLHLTALEGAGEVQTPLAGPGAAGLRIGDLVWFRHAKSGELFEHTGSVQLLSGSELVGEAATYRGLGQAF
ncbi:amino acid deaminase/aldolase [Nocardioides coralli]|uniref:amino acid deaminase/aldolase n=1 Tax=Nocardioides coralli TaxID=2872154 RepID=UPI001CA438B7|nr:amino acid deaminase/aldolase [Nocardioides coralli]QZY30544.1 amino acid deaminase/aldolase [Nocardioides coralli]